MTVIVYLVLIPVAFFSYYGGWITYKFYQKINQKKESIFPYKDIKYKLENNLLDTEELRTEAKRIKLYMELAWVSYAIFFITMIILKSFF